LQGPLRQGRTEGCGRRRQPGRRDHVHPHLLHQLHHDVALLRAGAAEVLMTATSTLAKVPKRAVSGIGTSLAGIGEQLSFYAKVMGEVLFNFRIKWKYKSVVFNLVSDITIGAGALIVGGGMVFVIFSMSFFTGTEVGLQGFKGLQQIGAEAFTGLIGS